MDHPKREQRELDGPAEQPISAQQFAELFAESANLLWLIAAGIVRDASSADDCLQDAALIALGKTEQYRPGSNFTAWMGSVVRFVALNHARKQRRRDHGELDPNTPQPGSRAPKSGMNDTGARIPTDGVASLEAALDSDMSVALSELSDVARACLLLRTIEGMDYAHIAEVLDIPEGTAMSHVHRARRFLRDRLRESHEHGAAKTDRMK